MTATYYLGGKRIHSKKKDKDFFMITVLSRNNYGDWQTVDKFCDETLFTQITAEIVPGSPVICSLDMSGNLIQCVAHDTFPVLELPDE